MRQILTRLAIIFSCVGVGVQLVPIGTTMTETSARSTHVAETIAPQVGAIFDRACQDCHSNQTRLPWYGQVAPVSWILSRDVRKGREKLDFSQWTGRAPSKNERMEICDAVSDGSMPLRAYTVLHPNARLSKYDVDLICDWAEAPASNEHPLQAESSNAAEALTKSDNVRRARMKGFQ